MDTPGIHKPKSKLGNVMVENAFGSIGDCDVLLFLIEATSKEIGKGDRLILDNVLASLCPSALSPVKSWTASGKDLP